MELAKYKACICEGSAEEAIIDILVDNDLLIFKREEMLEECVIRCRSAKRFEERYLRKGFDEQISVIRILDSRREEFRLNKAYEQKIDVVNVITAPEIEMLIIHAEGAFDQFKRSGIKPSEFCKKNVIRPYTQALQQRQVQTLSNCHLVILSFSFPKVGHLAL